MFFRDIELLYCICTEKMKSLQKILCINSIAYAVPFENSSRYIYRYIDTDTDICKCHWMYICYWNSLPDSSITDRVNAEPGITFRDELLMTICRSRLNPWKSSESYFCSCCSGNSSYTGELCWHKNVRDDRNIFWITCSSEHEKRKTLHQKYFEGVSFKHS